MAENEGRLTDADLARLEALLRAHDRGGFYTEYWRLTGSNEALLQAHVATFSGFVGGLALGANMDIQNELKDRYKGIFELSQDVAEHFAAAVREDRRLGHAGNLTDITGIDSAFQAWDDAHIAKYFPANFYRALLHAWHGDRSKLGDILTPGTVSALDADLELYGWRYGKRASDFAALPGYKTVPVEGRDGERLETVRDASGQTVFVGQPHDAAAMPHAGGPRGLESWLPDLDPPPSLRQYEDPYEDPLARALDAPFRREADEKHYPFDREHYLWHHAIPGLVDRDRASQAPELTAMPPPPWPDAFERALSGVGDFFGGDRSAPSLAPDEQEDELWRGFWGGLAAPVAEPAHAVAGDGASPVPAAHSPHEGEAGAQSTVRGRALALLEPPDFQGGSREGLALPALAEADEGGAPPLDGEALPPRRPPPLGAQPEEVLEALPRLVAEGFARIEELMAATGAKVAAIEAAPARLDGHEIIRIVSEWIRREANKPRNASWHYDLRRNYTPPGPIPL